MFFCVFRNEQEGDNAKAENAIEQNVPAVKKLLSCQQCNKTFGKKSKLDIHMGVHTVAPCVTNRLRLIGM
jgi:hypothetical protein